ncbi:hypothetical protein [Mycobacterium sp. 236(2023)]|uniref:hypothetical protein n=1 Tax=Mycobacterium sp. 236(2023) TaxID=3038163 RepID=UPI002414E074|nr:hypothetical protein [Mycobacterium sp. 236(2023)]MDG4666682.1 hypothetical protein [Mycobacterium sp. 236(2023)]
MTKVRTFRFHATHGPPRLFDMAREQLNALAGLGLEIPHARSRFDERDVPLEYLADFDPQRWELITVETAVSTGRIAYMSLRTMLESENYLWIVLAYEHVITAWITDNRGRKSTNPLNVTGGPVWESYAQGELAKTAAILDWEQAYIRRVRAHQVLTALANRPKDRPNRERLERAAKIAFDGGTWPEAAAAGGWPSRSGLKAAIRRVLRAAERSHDPPDE